MAVSDSEALLARFNSIKVANYTAGRCSSMMCRPPRKNGSELEVEAGWRFLGEDFWGFGEFLGEDLVHFAMKNT